MKKMVEFFRHILENLFRGIAENSKEEAEEQDKVMYSKAFESAVELILKHEGGFVNDPDDPGGATKYGISNRSHPVDRDHDGDVDADDAKLITVEEAKEIYYNNYWKPMRCEEVSSSLALCLFDSAVNQGKNRAIKILQESIGVSIDGDFGPKTLSVVKSKDETRLFRDFQAYRILHYTSLTNLKKYWYGWMRRVVETTIEATKI